jgi:hypothetical protein
MEYASSNVIIQKLNGPGISLKGGEHSLFNSYMLSYMTTDMLPVAIVKFKAILPLDTMSLASWLAICGWLILLALWMSDTTDVPFIKYLPSVPGFPIVGNLVQLGTEQPRRLAELAKQYGPVFQVRLGNKVSPSFCQKHNN